MKLSIGRQAIGVLSTTIQTVFITLKVVNYINWSWWIVLSPLLVSTIAVIIVLMVARWINLGTK